jgi:hypothetical protein
MDRQLEVYSGRSASRRELNNAVVIAALLYRTGLPDFDRAYQGAGGDLRGAVAAIRQVVRSDRSRQPVLALAAATFGTVRPRSVRAAWMPGLRALPAGARSAGRGL